MSLPRRTTVATFASVFLLSLSAWAEQDPWSARVRALSDAPLATFQGMDCVSIHAPRDIVWRLLVAPEYAATWFFANSPRLQARAARYKKGPTAEKGDVLSLEAMTSEGPRHLDLLVIVAAPPDLLSFLVRSDDAELLDKGLERLSFTFALESVPDGVTDLTLASHYDSDSPFSALLSPTAARHQRERRKAILEMFRLIAEEAARQKYPPLHEVALTAPPPPVHKTLPPRK
ncbi:MAG TPA: SRPBCC family protein [Thermoanaerobaculia bacterium]